MESTSILDDIQTQASELVMQKLRSKSIVVARLAQVITHANQLGHSHESIHARLNSAGLEMSFKNYSTYLYRARKQAEPRAGATAKLGSYEPQMRTGSYEPNPALSRTSAASEGSSVPDPSATEIDNSSSTAVRDALTLAGQTSRKSYSSVVKQSLKPQQQAKSSKTGGHN